MKQRNNNDGQRTLIGLFKDRGSAEKAYGNLTDYGYGIDDINVVMSQITSKNIISDNSEKASDQNAALLSDSIKTGSTTGGLITGIAAAIGALGSNLLIPGLGLVALGPLAAGLLGAGIGGVGGGLIGALLSPDLPSEKANVYEEGVREGKIVISVSPRDAAEADKLASMFRDLNADEVYMK